MNGKVIAASEAVVPVVLIDSRGQSWEIDCVVDTAFIGDVTLPPEAVETMDLQYLETAPANIAGRNVIDCHRFEAHVLWDGVPRKIEIVELDDEPLLGMRLLKDHRLTIDVVDGGNVLIAPLSPTN